MNSHFRDVVLIHKLSPPPPIQAWVCLSALTFICVLGSTRPPWPLGAFASATSRLSSAKISPILITSALVKSPPAYRQIPVCASFDCSPTSGYRHHTPRFGPSGHIREGRARCHRPRCIFYRFYLGVCEKLAAGSGYVFRSALHVYHGQYHDQIHFQIYAVRLLSPSFYEPANSFNFRLSLDHVAEGGTLAEEVVSTIRTAQAFGTQSVLASLYDVSVQKAYNADCRFAVAQGIGLAFMFFSIYAAYALGVFRFLATYRLTNFHPSIPSIQLWHHAHQSRSC